MVGQHQGNMAEQRYVDNNVQGRDMMAWMAQRNMMTTHLARQMSHPPPVYDSLAVAETFSGLRLAQDSGQTVYKPLSHPESHYSTPGCAYPVPPPVTSHTPLMSDTQYMPSASLSLFPNTSTMSAMTKPVLAVPPVYRGSGDTLY